MPKLKIMLKIINFTFCFILSIIIPQSKNILVFGDRAGKRFTDNSRYLFFYYNHFIKDKKCIWLTKNKKILNYLREKGYRCYFANSLIGLYYGLRASWHIFNYSEEDTSRYTGKFRKNLNLFHGLSVKYCNREYFKKMDYKYKIIEKIFDFKYRIIKNCRVHPNANRKSIPWTAWEGYFPKNKYSNNLVSNLQRNIIVNNSENYDLNLFRTDDEITLLKEIFLKKKKVIGYFPTFRLESKELFIDIKNDNQLEEIDNLLGKNNSIIIIKKHQNSYSEDYNNLYNPEFDIINKLSKYKNFLTVKYDIDLTSILPSCDIIISDYSSLMVDYLFLKRSIILYTPDFKSYSKFPGIALDLENQKFAYKAQSFEELIEILENYFSNNIKFNLKHFKAREELKNQIFENQDCFKNVVNFINNN